MLVGPCTSSAAEEACSSSLYTEPVVYSPGFEDGPLATVSYGRSDNVNSPVWPVLKSIGPWTTVSDTVGYGYLGYWLAGVGHVTRDHVYDAS